MKNRNKQFISLIIFLAMTGSYSLSQDNIHRESQLLSFEDFLNGVRRGNLGFISQQFNVSIAQAQLEALKVFPDPYISVGYGNNDDRKLMMGQSAEAGLSYSVSLGDRRGAGISLADSRYRLSQLMLNAYYQNLRKEASKGYFAALRDLRLYDMQKETLDQLRNLARSDSLRLASGEVSAIDAMQSSLEARAFLGKVYKSLSEMQNSCAGLALLMGRKSIDTLEIPSDDFPEITKYYDLSDLIGKALENRVELMIAMTNREISEKNLRLIKVERAPELTINAGYSHNYIARNEIAPAPAYNAVTAGLEFPLKFSAINKGLLKAASLSIQQSEASGKEVENQIVSEVLGAFNRFVACNKNMNLYKTGIISDAEKILIGRVYSYQHGETGLVEVLNAQRTFTGLKKEYIDAKFECVCAFIDLLYSAGTWEIFK